MTIFRKHYLVLLVGLTIVLLTACRVDDPVIWPTKTSVGTADSITHIIGFYLLNEGNMGSNKATLDFYDYRTATYSKNIFPSRNPNIVSELGDVGNDLQIYGNRLYAVINASNTVEVMDAQTAQHIGEIYIPNCRYITFQGHRAYVSSYAGPVQLGNTQLGYVAEIDTATLTITRTVTVGPQPEEMAIVDGLLYVANSGGYSIGNYDNTVSVIDLDAFEELRKIEVAINPHRLKTDQYGDIYVSSRGDYYEQASNLWVIDSKTQAVKGHFDIGCSNFCIVGDSAYVFSYDYDKASGATSVAYALVDVKNELVVSRQFITDGTDAKIKVPYGIAVNSFTGEILVSDAKTYVVPGTLYCFSSSGVLQWQVTTGDIPAHIAFLKK